MRTDKLRNEYNNLYNIAESSCEKIVDKFDYLLKQESLSLAIPIENRIKSWDSIENKLKSLQLNINTITDLQDLIGLRIVLLFKRDFSKIKKIISDNFYIIKSYDTQERLSEDQFGYSSIHYVIKVPSEISQNYNLKVEVQVRTLAQHLWAASSHVLQYKKESSVPPTLRRSIYRVSALLELVDLEFERVLMKRDEYRSEMGLYSNEELNIDMIEKTLDMLWPKDNKNEDENYDYLISSLKRYGIETQKQLTEIIKKHKDKVLQRSAREAEFLRNAAETYGVNDKNEIVINEENVHSVHKIIPELLNKVKKGIIYSHVALTMTAVQFEYGERSPDEPIN